MKIMVIGDSTGVSASHLGPGGGYSGVSPWTECVIAGQLLDEKFGPGAFTFVNVSHGGTGYGDWLNGNSVSFIPYNIPSIAKLIADNPDVDLYYIQLGINNALKSGTISGVEFAVRGMHQAITAAGKKVIFGTPNPISYGTSATQSLLWSMKEKVITTCADLGVLVVDHWAAWAATGVWWKLLADKIHPLEEGYRFKGQTLFMTLAYANLT